MDDTAEYTLNNALIEAVDECWESVHDFEERGGVILYNPSLIEYKFVFLTNSNTGTEIAPVLFTADRQEFADKVIPLFRDGWKSFASFHTHPKFPPYPSNIDMTELFPGFNINYIYSGVQDKLIKYQWVDPKELNQGLIPELIELN